VSRIGTQLLLPVSESYRYTATITCWWAIQVHSHYYLLVSHTGTQLLLPVGESYRYTAIITCETGSG